MSLWSYTNPLLFHKHVETSFTKSNESKAPLENAITVCELCSVNPLMTLEPVGQLVLFICRHNHCRFGSSWRLYEEDQAGDYDCNNITKWFQLSIVGPPSCIPPPLQYMDDAKLYARNERDMDSTSQGSTAATSECHSDWISVARLYSKEGKWSETGGWTTWRQHGRWFMLCLTNSN